MAAKSNSSSVCTRFQKFPSAISPPELVEKMEDFSACACQLSWTVPSRARIEPLCNARGRENSGAGLNILGNKFLSTRVKALQVYAVVARDWTLARVTFPSPLRGEGFANLCWYVIIDNVKRRKRKKEVQRNTQNDC